MTIQYRAWDQTSGTAGDTVDLSGNGATGGTTAFSTAIETASLTVKAVNDVPVRTAGTLTPINVEEDSANRRGGDAGAERLDLRSGRRGGRGGPDADYTLTAIPAYVQIFKADGTTQVLVERHGDGGGTAGPEVQDGGRTPTARGT